MNIDDFKIGMNVIITGYPGSWSSRLNPNYPAFVHFPYTCTIKKIDRNIFGNYSMTCGRYGWDLTELIEQNKIHATIKELRKQKLKELENVQTT